MTPATPTCLLSLFAFCAACAPDAAPPGQPLAVVPASCSRAIDPMVVEVLPVQPPGSHPLIGSMRMENSSYFRWDDANFMMNMKKQAAAMGGNTIVYTEEDDPCRARVFYIPEDCGSHGGDEE